MSKKLTAFTAYVRYKSAYYPGEPVVSDRIYDQFEAECREAFPEDPDFEMPGYGQAHDDRLEELKIVEAHP